jgi:pimeloyl-ACP methyl ester carboxylesterase
MAWSCAQYLLRTCVRSRPVLAMTVLSLLLAIDRSAVDANAMTLMEYMGTDGQVHPVQTPADWSIRRGQILDGMQAVMGTLPDLSAFPSLNVQVQSVTHCTGYDLSHLAYTGADNVAEPAYLFMPTDIPSGTCVPAIVALHETTTDPTCGKNALLGLDAHPQDQTYAMDLVQRGYAVLAPDYPGYGELSNYDFAHSAYPSGSLISVINSVRGVSLLQSLAQVDPARIGAIGHSLGGHAAMFLGAFDPRVKVVVSSGGWTPFHYYAAFNGGNLANWAQPLYMPRISSVYHNSADEVPFDLNEVAAAMTPGAFFSNSPTQDGIMQYLGVQRAEPSIQEVFDLLGTSDNMQFVYPDAIHSFPPDVRQQAYQFIDQALHAPEPGAIALLVAASLAMLAYVWQKGN